MTIWSNPGPEPVEAVYVDVQCDGNENCYIPKAEYTILIVDHEGKLSCHQTLTVYVGLHLGGRGALNPIIFALTTNAKNTSEVISEHKICQNFREPTGPHTLHM